MSDEVTVADVLPFLTHEQHGREVQERAGLELLTSINTGRTKLRCAESGPYPVYYTDRLPVSVVNSVAFAVLGVLTRELRIQNPLAMGMSLSYNPGDEVHDEEWGCHVLGGNTSRYSTREIPTTIFAVAREVLGIGVDDD